MARPNILCRLFKGKLIDTFTGFVDTFNYLVDFVENLKGDGDIDASKSITIDRSVPDRPIIRFTGSTGGGGSVTLVGTDGSTATGSSITFASAQDSNVSVSVADDGNGNVTATIGVYWVDEPAS